jgi:hypothetical protein
MNCFFSTKLNHIIVVISLLFFTSCGLKPIVSEYTFIKTDFEKIELEKLGNGNVLIYNGANVFHKIDNTARLNVWIDDKPLGQIKPNEYVIINMKDGRYTFKALHKDVVNMRSEHDVEIDKNTKVIKIKPNITSNKLEVINELPNNFEKFSYSKKIN